MKLYDMIHMCLQNLLRRKVRTLLTVVGVVVGTCSIVVMISIGIGMKESQEALLAELGDLTIIEVFSYGGIDENGDPLVMDDEFLEHLNTLSPVVVATPFYYPYHLNMELVAGREDRYTSYLDVVGIYPDALANLGYEGLEGDLANAFAEPFSIVMGQYADYNFRDNSKRPGYNRASPYPDEYGDIEPPVLDIYTEDLSILMNPQDENAEKLYFETNVTARLVEDWGKGYETSRGVFMNIYDIHKLEEAYNKENNIKSDDEDEQGYENAKVKVTSIDQVEAVEEYIQDFGFETYSLESIRKPMEEQAQQQQMILGSLGAISLFVAAIGITNTMIMSIYERTREIGIMKVVGCYVNDIRTIFLMEAGTIGFCGGVIGIAISYLISFLMNYFGFNLNLGGDMFGSSSMPGTDVSIIPLWLVGMALVFSTLIGLISGYYPANRAVKISALSAIKQDN